MLTYRHASRGSARFFCCGVGQGVSTAVARALLFFLTSMNTWFKKDASCPVRLLFIREGDTMKTDGLQHPKTNRLMVILDLKRYEAVGILECLFVFASRWCADGRIGKYPPAEPAADIGWQGPPGVPGSYTHLRAHATLRHLRCLLLLVHKNTI